MKRAMHWARQSRLAGVLTGGAVHVAPTKGTTAILFFGRSALRASSSSVCTSCVNPWSEAQRSYEAVPGGVASYVSELAVNT